MVTVFTSKVELGTGVETALAQIVAEELDIPFNRLKMEVGDTAKTIDQSESRLAAEHRTRGPTTASGRRSGAPATTQDGIGAIECTGRKAHG